MNQDVENARQRAETLYRTGQFLCSEAVFHVANEYLGYPVSSDMVKLASGFPVGIGVSGCVCGTLSGGVMALGLKYGRTSPGAPTPGMFDVAKELHDRFRVRRKRVCCRSLTHQFDHLGSPEHMERCTEITGEVAADVVELLSREELR